MFSFLRRGKQAEVHRIIRRMLDEGVLPTLPGGKEERWENRSNRTLPVLLVPIDNGEPRTDEATTALTKNLSSQGLALVLHQPFWAEGVAIGLWHEGSAEFVRGEIRQNVPLGGGFWQLGIELTEPLSLDEHPELEDLLPLAARLDPRRELVQ